MTSTRLLLCFLFAASLLFTPSTAFTCGANRFQNFITRIFITLDCHSRLSQFDNCCRTHDSCYDRQGGRASCDNSFCACLNAAASGTLLCHTDSNAFCSAVRRFGQKAYENAGKKRG